MKYIAFQNEKKLRALHAQYVEQVNTILYLHWDPIGCGVPLDEYSFYADYLVAFYLDDEGVFGFADKDKLVLTLRRFSDYHMGVGRCEEKAAKTADILCERYPRASDQFHRGLHRITEGSGSKVAMAAYRTPVLCNCCGLSCVLPLQPQDDFSGGNHGLINAKVTGGYHSTAGNGDGALDDLSEYKFSLCEFCLDWLFQHCQIPPEVRNYDDPESEHEPWRSAYMRVMYGTKWRKAEMFLPEFNRRNAARDAKAKRT